MGFQKDKKNKEKYKKYSSTFSVCDPDADGRMCKRNRKGAECRNNFR